MKPIKQFFFLFYILFSLFTLANEKPNILFCIADDWGLQASIFGEPELNTPNFDEISRTGVTFTNAFCTSPSCSPSRASILTGKWHWQLETGANLYGTIPAQHKFYTAILSENGYHVGYTKKGWGPGTPLNNQNPAGKQYKNFDEFLNQKPKDSPFCFWFGSHNPHRPYKPHSGEQNGIKLPNIRLPKFLPDSPEVRTDIADYFLEVQAFDTEVGELINSLKKIGAFENTIIIITSDHGMPFPRCKSNLYDSGTKVPLAIKIPNGANNRRISHLTSLVDLAPTILELTGIEIPKDMSGISLAPLLKKDLPNDWTPRKSLIYGKERHVPTQENDLSGYPCRALRTEKFLLIKNYEPTLWPAGTPNADKAFLKNFWLADCDNGLTKSYLVDNADNDEEIKKFYNLSFAKRPGFELYDLSQDPEQINNLAQQNGYQEILLTLSKELELQLIQAKDPRTANNDKTFDSFPYSGGGPKKEK